MSYLRILARGVRPAAGVPRSLQFNFSRGVAVDQVEAITEILTLHVTPGMSLGGALGPEAHRRWRWNRISAKGGVRRGEDKTRFVPMRAATMRRRSSRSRAAGSA
jgi:glutamate synthase domain-containing protein 2